MPAGKVALLVFRKKGTHEFCSRLVLVLMSPSPRTAPINSVVLGHNGVRATPTAGCPWEGPRIQEEKTAANTPDRSPKRSTGPYDQTSGPGGNNRNDNEMRPQRSGQSREENGAVWGP